MFSVALIGVDGAGKTTIANKLLESFPVPMKYLYMGIHIPSSNVALPTSRLAYYLKLRSYQKSGKNANLTLPKSVPVHHPEYRPVQRGIIGTAARLFNRISEESFRQIVSWSYQLRGYIVLYDRHFLFDFAPKRNGDGKRRQHFSDRLHFWFLNHLYPRPDMVIFLDAPPKVLLARKNEGTYEYLQTRREMYLEQGKKVTNFIRIDATQPLDAVYSEIVQHITSLYNEKHFGKTL
jgi:thymidylate kinase